MTSPLLVTLAQSAVVLFRPVASLDPGITGSR